MWIVGPYQKHPDYDHLVSLLKILLSSVMLIGLSRTNKRSSPLNIVSCVL